MLFQLQIKDVLLIWSSEVLCFVIPICYIIEVLKYFRRWNIYSYWQQLLEPLETYALLIYTDFDRCYILFCMLFKIIQVSVCEPLPTVFIWFSNTYSMFHNHLTSPVCNLDIDNLGGLVPAYGELLPCFFISRYCKNISVLISLLLVCCWNMCTCMFFY